MLHFMTNMPTRKCKSMLKNIPKHYSIANLYVDITPNSDKKTLVFYAKNKNEPHWFFGDRIAEIEFETFNLAYKFILENEIEVYNISQGSYAKEIKKYNENILKTGQLFLF